MTNLGLIKKLHTVTVLSVLLLFFFIQANIASIEEETDKTRGVEQNRQKRFTRNFYRYRRSARFLERHVSAWLGKL